MIETEKITVYEIPFKLFDKDSEIPRYHIIDWDLMVDGIPYSVAHMEGFVHTQGGRWGINDMWAWPRGHIPTYKNLVPFNSKDPVSWGLEYREYNHVKYHEHDWGDDNEVDSVCGTWITRNCSDFIFIMGEMSYSLPKAQSLIFFINEHPINFNSVTWKEDLVGRKVWYNDEPAIVESVWFDEWSGYRIALVPDGIEKFSCPNKWRKEQFLRDSWSEYEQRVICELINPEYNKIDWFRD